MKKRIISFLLALVLVLGLIPAAATTANAASSLSTSAKAIDILKGSVTFYEKETAGKIGYGTDATFVLDGETVAKTYKNGISKEDATDLLRAYLKEKVDKKINDDFTKKNNIDLTQNEHDALAVHYYRMGNANAVFEAVRTIKTVNSAADRLAILHAFVGTRTYNATSAEVLLPTLNVSLAEAAMYLYGDYGYNGGSKLAYVLLDKNGDMKSDSFAAYIKNDGYNLPVVTGSLGWFLYDSEDKEITGAPMSKLTKDHNGKMIVAKMATGGNVAAEYTINTNTLIETNLYDYPSSGPVKRDERLRNNTEFKVIYEFLDSDNVKWIYGTGKNTDKKDTSGWVKVGKQEAAAPENAKPIATATVTVGTLKVRAGATSGSNELGSLTKGDVVNIYEIKEEKTETGNQNWGKVIVNGKTGWINLAYAEVNETLGESGKPEGQTGKIANTDKVNVRSKDEVSAATYLTTLKQGTKVTILEMNAARTWAKVKWAEPSDGYTQGWVYMQYIQLDSAYAGSSTTTPDTVKYTGVVTSNINLNVRKSADIYATKVDSLANGTKINIYETKTSRNMKWGRIGDGRWVCLTYVSLTEVQQPAGGSSTATTTSTQATVTSTVLNVLKTYNNNAEILGTLKKGDVVTILEKNTESTGTGSRIWGRISKDGLAGWINLAYVELKTVTSVNGTTGTGSTGSTGNNANGANGIISDCISVNVREGAGVSNAQITKLNNGTAVKVYEQVTKDNAPWAKITWNNGANSGWVCMNYVTMTAGTTGTTEGGLVNGTNSNTISATGIVNSNIDLNVRSIAGLDGIKLGALKKGTKVTVYEQVSADGMIWGRIQYGNGSGWICMSYISIESASSTGKGVMGTIARCFAAVNVRSAPGTNNALINKIAVGTRVEVFETKQHGTQLWGRVAQGWICMDYVLLDTELPPGTALDATVPTTAPTQATEPKETINKDNEVGYTVKGVVTTSGDPLYVRNDASTDSDKVGEVNNGLEVKILALKNNNAELWGRIDQYATAGWVRMDYVNYSVKGYVNTDEQPIYANANTSSGVKGKLALNKELTITKLTVNGETVFGWVEEGLNGWIPMGRISNEPVEVIATIKDNTNNVFAYPVVGTANADITAYDAINGNNIACYVKSGATVYVGAIKAESRIVWGKIAYTKDGVDTAAWIDMSKVTYVVPGTVSATKLEVWTTKDNTVEENILGYLEGNPAISICELSFDSMGRLWGKVTGNANTALNGGYVLMEFVSY